MKRLIWDTEILGLKNPVFLLRAYCPEEDKHYSFWFDKRGHMDKLYELIQDESYTWIGFNSKKFDSVITAMATMLEVDAHMIKELAQRIISERLQPFQIYKGEFQAPAFDDTKKFTRWAKDEEISRHIDIFDVAPGVKTSLKIYMGRMHAKKLQDLPYHHDEEIDTPKKRKIVEEYCGNDIAGTLALADMLTEELELRRILSEEFKLDLMSKSDAQMAEAIFKKVLDLPKASSRPPEFVRYTAPPIIKTKNKTLLDLIEMAESWLFEINETNGRPIQPSWMEDGLVKINNGVYKFGLGGLHSQHDVKLHIRADDEWEISDFDAASYYPFTILKCGFIPRMSGGKGKAFIELYEQFLQRRLEAKRAGNKKVANSLKILLNGTYGKLGELFSRMYAPDLMLGVTITGQLNLLCLIDELEKLKDVSVVSANTDGIMVKFKKTMRDKVQAVFNKNSKRTGYEYEETPYRWIALRDVNNYMACTIDGKIKAKGAFNDVDSKPDLLRTHREFSIISKAALAHINNGTPVEETVLACKDIRDFVSMANGDGKSGGIQTVKLAKFDEWVEVEPKVWKNHLGKQENRKSRPKPYEGPVSGSEQRLGRIVRWYISTDRNLPAIRTVNGLRQVPLTEGGRVCMELPDKFPKDVDLNWYIERAKQAVLSMGVTL